ncbi:hypothetical protein PRZ48_002416 [Zasmidium cellare]|uniref:Uncharacterized protein n=1 Tax=Zasmidium cellare TaxID=395010 RepID=A0ABR0F3Y4_ZASCE|nr:hypothetical protein PRZ48_002416 [Zasmidium cellare]
MNKASVAVADCLRWLWQLIKAKVERDEDDPEIFDTALLTVVLTVPATWSERARYCMQRAAKAAGIPEQTIKLISEPEAAAIFSMKKEAKEGTDTERRLRGHPLSLDQVTVSNGGFCGSAFIDTEFQNQVKQILGADWDRLARIEDDFEYKIKRTYNPTLPKKYSISVTGLEDDEDCDISNGNMAIDEAVLSQAFESVMTPIGTLIDGQIAASKEKGLEETLKGILLWLRIPPYSNEGRVPGKNDVKIWRPDKTWTSVVQGAVACEASGSGSVAVVHSRLSGYNYGVPYATQSGKKVKWLVRKGQPVQTNMATEPYGLRIDDQDWLDEDTHCHLLVPMVRSEEDDALDDYGPLVTPHAEIDCRVPTHLRHSKEATLIQERPRKAWHIPATLVLFLDGAAISFKCMIQGEEVGVTNPRAGTWLGVPTTIQTKRGKKPKEKDKFKKASTSNAKFDKETFVPPEGLPTYERKPSQDKRK